MLVVSLYLARHQIGRGPLAAVLIFGGVLLPAIGFIDVYAFVFSYVADHFQYHASMALIALAAAGGTLLARRLPTVARAARSRWQRGCSWSVLRSRTTRLMPITARRHCSATWSRPARNRGPDILISGLALVQQQKDEEALVEFREAERLFPEHLVTHTVIGNTLVKLGGSTRRLPNTSRAGGRSAHYRRAQGARQPRQRAEHAASLR